MPKLTIVIALGSLALAFGVPAPASAGTAQTLPTPAAAGTIVSNLWSGRERAFALLDATKIDSLELASARRQDDRYIASVQCGCEAKKDPHPALQIIPEIPKTSVQPVFFAQVRTINTHSHDHPWYVVAVERDAAGNWKLAYINFGGYKPKPPLQTLTDSSTSTPRVTATSDERITHLAETYIAQWATHHDPTGHTSYGATIHYRPALELNTDGIYGLTLTTGKLLSCFTMHSLETYTLPAGLLQQDATQSQWGHLLAPGTYTSITIDNAEPVCALGSGIGNAPGALRLSYQPQVVATTGVPS